MSAADSKMFIYLVQGQAKLVKNYVHLSNRTSSHLISLTYDEPLDGSIFFPNSTWAEGRNRLLVEVEKLGVDYEYLVYCDDDVVFYMGDWDVFEESILAFRPALAVPVVSRTVKTISPFPFLDVQRFTYNDEQLMAIRKDVVTAKKILPYKTELDSLHWWATCYAQELLIQKHYRKDVLQINRCRVLNLEHDRYTSDETSQKIYKSEVVKQLSAQGISRKLDETPSVWWLVIRTLLESGRSSLMIASQFVENVRKNYNWLISNKTISTLDALEDHISPHKDYVIYGFGDLGKRVHQIFQQGHVDDRLIGILDQRAYLGITQVDGISISKPSDIMINERVMIILASYGSTSEMVGFLRDVKHVKPEQLITLVKPKML